jgi:hypothetical protein
MNLLKTIIERLNQRVEVANIFDKQFGLCELNANGNEKAWVHYIGNGQAEVVTNFDAKQGTLFWAKRGKVTVVKTDAYKMSGCKQLYVTSFPLTAYAVVRKSHLPCDGDDAQDWLASRIYKLTSGTDPQFKQNIGVINYEVIPSGYINEIKTLTANYEWACVTVDFDIQVITTTEDGCYDICATGDIPLPDFQPCTPCLTEVAVDGITIIGNGTEADPLIAIGGGGGGGIMTAIAFSTDHLSATGNQYVIGNVVWYNGNIYRCIANNDSILPTNATYWTNLGAGFQTIERPSDWNATTGNNQILNKPTIPAAQVNSDWNATSGLAEILNKPTIPVLPATIVEDVTATAPIASTGGANPDISITQADGSTDGYLSSTDWNTFDGKFDVPTGLVTDYLDGLGSPQPFPTIPTGTVTSVATAGLISGGPITTSGTITTAMTTNKLVGRATAGSGIMEEITIGSGLTLTGAGVLNNTATPTPTGYYGAFQDDTTQTAVSANTAYPVKFNTTDLSNGVSIVNDGSANPTRVTLANTGIYNIQFSLQLEKTGGSGNFVVDLWIRKNGIDIPATTGKIVLTGSANASPVVAAWNYLLDLVAGDYVQLMWATSNNNAVILASAANPPHPSIPSSILTVTQQAGILAGTGITALNSLTGSAQTLVTGTTGTDFAVVSSGTSHTFNLPTASSTNRGALSTTDWSTFNGKQDALVSGTNIKTINSTSLLGSGNITIASLGVYKNTTDGAASSGTANTFSQSVLVPGNSVVAGNVLEFKLRGRKTGANNTYTIRIYANSANNLTGAVLLGVYVGGQTGAFGQQMVRTGVVKNATTNTEMMSVAVTNVATDFQNTTFSTIAVDWTTDKYIIGAVQNTNGADSSLISLISMTII